MCATESDKNRSIQYPFWIAAFCFTSRMWDIVHRHHIILIIIFIHLRCSYAGPNYLSTLQNKQTVIFDYICERVSVQLLHCNQLLFSSLPCMFSINCTMWLHFCEHFQEMISFVQPLGGILPYSMDREVERYCFLSFRGLLYDVF